MAITANTKDRDPTARNLFMAPREARRLSFRRSEVFFKRRKYMKTNTAQNISDRKVPPAPAPSPALRLVPAEALPRLHGKEEDCCNRATD